MLRPILAPALGRQSEADADVASPPSLHCPRPRAGVASFQKSSFMKFDFFVALLLLAGAVRGFYTRRGLELRLKSAIWGAVLGPEKRNPRRNPRAIRRNPPQSASKNAIRGPRALPPP